MVQVKYIAGTYVCHQWPFVDGLLVFRRPNDPSDGIDVAQQGESFAQIHSVDSRVHSGLRFEMPDRSHLGGNLNPTPMTTDPHFQLVERCKAGDPMAQFELHRKYRSAMLRVAWRFTHDDFEAEDIVQEAFLKAFRSLAHFKGDSTFGAWLKRITINTSINALKKKQLEMVPLEGAEIQDEVPDLVSMSESTISPTRIHQAIDRLPAGYRQVLTLYLLEGYDHQEISGILSISEATSKSQFCRARRKLQSILQRQPLQYEAA